MIGFGTSGLLRGWLWDSGGAVEGGGGPSVPAEILALHGQMSTSPALFGRADLTLTLAGRRGSPLVLAGRRQTSITLEGQDDAGG